MTRLAGIDIGAPPEIVLPIFLLALLLLSAVAARVARKASARLLSGPGGGDRPDKTPPPQLGIPIGGAVLIGGLMAVLPELTLPGRLGHWLGAAFDLLFVRRPQREALERTLRRFARELRAERDGGL